MQPPAATEPLGVQVPWRTLAEGRTARVPEERVDDVRRVVLRVIGAALGVLLVVGLLGIVVVRRMAEREALNGASQLTDQLARTVIIPVLDDGLLTGDPAALERFDEVVRSRVLTGMFVRVKVWSPEGVVLYSDRAELIGEQYPLEEDKRRVLAMPATVAEVSTLEGAENRLERDLGRLVEVYRPVWTPSGQPLLFETYTDYSVVTTRTGGLWRGFGGTVISSLLLFVVLLTPLIWTLTQRLRQARQGRELLLRKAIDASQDERRRIAADLHDGVVQDLVATSLMVAGAADRAAASGADAVEVAGLRSAAAAVRSSVGSLRTLLVDIYPPSLSTAGLPAALEDLVAGLRNRGMVVDLSIDDAAAARLGEEQQRLVYRSTHECLRNIVRHAGAQRTVVWLGPDVARPSVVVLQITDDGAGIDDAVLTEGREGHFGLRLITDLAAESGTTLRVATAPGRGTTWRWEMTT